MQVVKLGSDPRKHGEGLEKWDGEGKETNKGLYHVGAWETPGDLLQCCWPKSSEAILFIHQLPFLINQELILGYWAPSTFTLFCTSGHPKTVILSRSSAYWWPSGWLRVSGWGPRKCLLRWFLMRIFIPFAVDMHRASVSHTSRGCPSQSVLYERCPHGCAM